LDGHTFTTGDTTVVLTWTETSYGEKTYTKLLNGASIGTETITLTDPNTPYTRLGLTLETHPDASFNEGTWAGFHNYAEVTVANDTTAPTVPTGIFSLWYNSIYPSEGDFSGDAHTFKYENGTWTDVGSFAPHSLTNTETYVSQTSVPDGQYIYLWASSTLCRGRFVSPYYEAPSTLKWNFSDKHDGTEGFSVHDDQTPPCYVEKASDGTWSLTLTGVLADRQDQSPGNNWDYIETIGGTVYLKYKGWDTGGYWSGPYTRAQWSSSIGSETIRIYEHSSYSEQYNNGIYLIQESSSSTPPPTQITNLFASHASGGEYGPVGVYTVIHSSSTPTLFVWQLGNSAWGGLLDGHTISYDTTTKIWADVGSGNPYYVCDGSTWTDTAASSPNQQTLSFWQNSTHVVFELTNPYYEA
jgi:hypothetical protein